MLFSKVLSLHQQVACLDPKHPTWIRTTLRQDPERVRGPVVPGKSYGSGLYSRLEWLSFLLSLRGKSSELSNERDLSREEMAEGVRFELTEPVKVRRFSRPLP
jgi:hypothetical protein